MNCYRCGKKSSVVEHGVPLCSDCASYVVRIVESKSTAYRAFERTIQEADAEINNALFAKVILMEVDLAAQVDADVTVFFDGENYRLFRRDRGAGPKMGPNWSLLKKFVER